MTLEDNNDGIDPFYGMTDNEINLVIFSDFLDNDPFQEPIVYIGDKLYIIRGSGELIQE
jgi:hypothetical protein